MPVVEFGTDGIRGTAGEWPTDAQGALQVGLGIGSYLRRQMPAPAVVIGRDTRSSGSALASGVTTGLLSQGVRVIDVGVITTAGAAYLARKHGLAASVMISASHNPWTENGIKVMGGDGYKISDDAEQAIAEEITRLIEQGAGQHTFGVLEQQPGWVEEYIEFLTAHFAGGKLAGLRVGIDCSHGAASAIAGRCFELVGCQTFVIGADPDGMNINRGAGSEVVRNGKAALYDLVREHKLDLAVAFDGDADRAVFIDETGKMLDGDHVLFILGGYLKAKGQLGGNKVVSTVMANSGLDHALNSQGITLLRTKVGDKYIVREMLANGYSLGGEQSGHILIFDDPEHTTGDGIYTALYMAGVLAESRPETLHTLAAPLIKLPQVVASARVASKPDLDEIEALKRMRAEISSALGEGVTMNTRYSGTEPVFRTMMEGRADHSLEDIARHAVSLCRAVQAAAGNPGDVIEVKDTTTGSLIDISGLE